MIRTVWLTIACLALLGALAVGKARTAVAPTSSEAQVDETTAGTDLAQDTLTKADRLGITYVRQESPAQAALLPTEPFIPPVQKIVPPVETKIISGHCGVPKPTTPLSGARYRHQEAGTTQ